MINKDLTKNAWIAIAVFVFTLLPLGTYNTDFGLASLLCFFLWGAFTYISYILMRDLFKSSRVLKTASYYQQKFERFLFLNDERKFRFFIFIIPIIFSFIVGQLIWHGLPVIEDTLAQYTHSRLLAMGLFSVPNHPLPQFFPMVHVITTGERWYSQYQLGHLLPLALGHFLGIIWLVNPIMCGISALVLYLIAYDNYGLRIARITGLLTILCTQWWYMASEYMNHNTTLLGCMIFVWAWLRLLKTFEYKYSFLAGLGIGLALITRPITAFPIALPFAIYGLCRLWHEPVKRWLAVLPTIVVTVVFIAWQLYFNLRTTGDFLVFAPEILYGDQVKYGFGHLVITDVFQDFYKGTAHSFWRGIGHSFNNLIGLNVFLFNWPIPSLLFVFLGVMVFKPSTITKLMFCSWAFMTVAYIPYFYQDWALGPRYMYEITGFLIVATSIGIVRIPATLRVLGWKMKRSEIILKTNILVCFLFLSGMFLFTAGMPRHFSNSQYSYGIPTFQIDAQFPDNSLVFANKLYDQFTIFMPPLDSNRVIYAMDSGVNNQKLINYYPQRKVFLETKDGFRQLGVNK